MDVKALIQKQREMLEAIEPTEVEVLLGGRVVTVVMPYVMPVPFSDLASKHAPETPLDVAQVGFSLDGVARNYPDIVIRDGEDEDDLLTVLNKAVHYGWPEMYDVLTHDDRASIRASVWGTYVWRSQQEKKKLQEVADES
ncbi:hypothetical protein [Microbacterium azadirachtae]|uniref:Tail assembly chaperone n=1 Tax=Microbacterium azadirachtae TaxID=582680 RepID=A0A0F0LRY7_9MICO|nr:hypothetical protein [Microbacterium azadirachtae]KJL35469.1 hypothetical protein RS86_00465 [Microbacterium azadirachtae]